MGYLGKISAIVTVNTSDVAPKLAGMSGDATRHMRAFENTLRNAGRNSAKAFGDIYTTSQKVERALAAASQGAIKGWGADATAAFRKAREAAGEIASPLKQLAGEIEKSSGMIRSRFEPALVAAQAAAEGLFDKIRADADVSSDEIKKVIKTVDDLSAAFDRAKSAADKADRAMAAAQGNRTDLRRERRNASHIGETSSIEEHRAMLRREEFARNNVGLSSDWRRERRNADFVGETSSIAEHRAMLAREEFISRNVGMRTDLRRERENAANVGLTSSLAFRREELQRVAMAERRDAYATTERERLLSSSVGMRTNLAYDRRLAAHVGETSSIAEHRAMVRREEFASRNVGMASSLAAHRRTLANIGASSPWMPGIRNQQIMANIGASSPVTWMTPWRPGLRQPAGAVTHGVGASSPWTPGVRRATGDVGRGGGDRFGLALQQAAFAVDDFTSVTGGLDMKLRAVQNNLSQLGFILGGTTGLFAALGVAIASQAGIALMRWINDGRTAEDQTKALNDALEKQKSLADSLAQSFESLADAIAQSAMSAESFAGRQLDKQLEGIKKQQKDSREEELFRLSPGVNAARASQNVADKAIKAATNETEMLAAQNLMTRAKADEERAKAAVRARASAGVSRPEIMSAITQSFYAEAAQAESARVARAAGAAGGTSMSAPTASPEAVNANAARLAEAWLDRNVNAGMSGRDVLASRASELVRRGQGGSAFRGDAETIVALQRGIEILKLPMKESADDLSVTISRASSEAASRIKEAQDRVAEAIQAGVPGAAEFSVSLARTADALATSQDKILAAAKESDPVARRAMVDAAQNEVAAISGEASRQLAASRDMMFGGLGVKGGRGGQLSGLRRVEGAGGALAALEGSAEFGGRGGAQATALRALIARESASRSDLSRAMTFGNGDQRMQAAFNLEQAQEQLRKFTDGLPEEIKAAGDAVKMAARQAGRDEKSRAEMVERGRDLLASPKSKIVAAFRKDLEAATLAAGGPGGAGVAEFVKNRLMEAAPAVAQMNAERAAAINPPYYSALQASDTSTAEGQKELNRLLRGEDASKDKNLDELKTQSELLRDLIAIARQNGIIVDL